MTNAVAVTPVQLQIIDRAIEMMQEDEWARGTSYTLRADGKIGRCIGGTIQAAGVETINNLSAYEFYEFDQIQQGLWSRANDFATNYLHNSLVSWNDNVCHSKMEALGFLMEFRREQTSLYSRASLASTSDSSEDASFTVE